MKILVIRGKNLAALAGKFTVDFRCEPLASAGLFSISGATGSGKSTLLDALCLALYGKTPRLNRVTTSKNTVPDVAGETITPLDPRNLLRRGEGEGYAEVAFIGTSGEAYAARWSVNRAHNKPTGALQPVTMRCVRMHDRVTTPGRKQDILDAIAVQVGLSFDQFTRTVLLAQSDFSAFLKANENDRIDLLQKLTGAEIYRLISKRTYERAKEEAGQLEILQQRMGDYPMLSDEERTQRVADAATAHAAWITLDARRSALLQQQQWHRTWESLSQRVQQADADWQNALADQESVAPRKDYLAQIEAVQSARPLLQAMDRGHAAVAQSHQAVQDAEQQMSRIQSVCAQVDNAFEMAKQALAQAEQTQHALLIDVQQVKILDAEWQTCADRQAEIATTRERAHREQAKTERLLSVAEAEQTRVAAQFDSARDWLSAHHLFHALAKEWLRWDVLLGEATRMHGEMHRAAADISEKTRDVKAQQDRRASTHAAWSAAKTECDVAQHTLTMALKEVATFSPMRLAHARETLQIRHECLTEAERLWREWDQARTQRDALDTEAQTLEAAITRADEALQQVLVEQPIAISRDETAQESLRIAEIACSEHVETLRETLPDGTACPACGAIAHPYAMAIADAPSRILLDHLRKTAHAAQTRVHDLAQQVTKYRTQLAHSHERLADIAAARAPLLETIAAARPALKTQWDTLGWTTITATDRIDVPAHFARHREAIHTEREMLSQQETAYQRVCDTKERAQTARDAAQQVFATAQEALNTADRAFEKAHSALVTAQNKHAEIRTQLIQQLTMLNPAFPNQGQKWWGIWHADPIDFHEKQRGYAQQWLDQCSNAEQLQAQLTQLQQQYALLSETLLERKAQSKETVAKEAIAAEHLQQAQHARAQWFNGRATADIEAECTTEITQAQSELSLQQTRKQRADTQCAIAVQTYHAAHSQLTLLQQQTEAATNDVKTWMAAFVARMGISLPLSTLRDQLAHDNDWLENERAVLQKITHAVQSTAAVAGECRERQKAHAQQRHGQCNLQEAAEIDDIDDIEAALQVITTEMQDTQAQENTATVDLQRDTERRDQRAHLSELMTTQAAQTRLWKTLNELIGSSDGKKLNSYAQQRTLCVLIHYANEHLRALSRRYRLQAVENSLALMVIDQEMGDELRTVHSLSGGESFLVSLALALGLASLSSNRIKIESLLIDEGFGSLDTETLRVVMDALDHLQAQGRTVGVVSHVQELSERIGVQIRVRRQSGGHSSIEIFP